MGDRETFITVPSVESSSSLKSKRVVKSAAKSTMSPDPGHDDILRTQAAVRRIEKWWGGVRDRRIFKIFKAAVCAAENSLTRDIVRKLSPSEAALLQDPAVRARIKFRLGGETFPPTILYKIFFSRDLIHVQYISGKTMIRPSTEAAEDASRQMSHRAMFDQMLTDACYHPKQKIQDEIDVATVKDYMQYRSVLDESPAYIGGKGNSWRTLSASALPRHSTMHSVAELLARAHRPGEGLPPPPPQAVGAPRYVCSVQSVLQAPQPRPAPSAPRSGRTSSRRSLQARERVEKMRQTYVQHSLMAGMASSTPTTTTTPASKGMGNQEEEEEEGSDWENDALMLYQWTKGL